MEKKTRMKKQILRIIVIINSHHTGAYAAQAAYFFVLSLIPIFLLLLTMLTRISIATITTADVLNAVLRVFPSSVAPLIRSIVNQVYINSDLIIPVTVVVALWSAGKGVLSVTSGLNEAYSNIETRNYFYLRIRASAYTVLFLLAIVFSLVLSVFGNSISAILYQHLPFLSRVVDFVMRIRTLVTLVLLTVFWDLVYKFLPNRRHRAKTTLRKQLPGAVFTACGWLLVSFVFSIYLDVFAGFSSMYGTLATTVVLMLWLYACMYIILLGGELNALLEKFFRRKKNVPDKKKEDAGESTVG